MKQTFEDLGNENVSWNHLQYVEIKSDESNYFQSFSERQLLRLGNKQKLWICFLYKQGTYLIKGTVFMKVYYDEKPDDDCINELISAIDFYKGQPIENNADYGFSQLAEIAIKALSPGINDPATAVLTLHALSDLFTYKLYKRLPEVRFDIDKVKRIYVPSSSFGDMFEKCIHPIWNYGKSDQYIQNELILMLNQLKTADDRGLYTSMFDNFIKKIQKHIEDNFKYN